MPDHENDFPPDPLGLNKTIRASQRPIAIGSDDADRLVGTTLHHYRIGEPLGKGAMGAVYRARDLSLDRPVAIKMIRGSFDNPLEHERLLQEARAQARLNHPNIVHIHYIGDASVGESASEGIFLAMELVEGRTMGQLLKEGRRLSAEEVRRAMLQVARGLRAAHRAGFIHRDIKPCNLLMDRDGTLKITDFGLARPIHNEGTIGTEGVIVGSPEYMSPEQGAVDAVDHRSDMYSLGATFYHLLVGRPVFEGASVVGIIQQHLDAPVPPLPKELPAPLAKILKRLLAKDPADRYASYDELIDALRAAAPTQTAHAGLWVRLASIAVELFFAALCVSVLSGIGLLLYVALAIAGQALAGQTPAQYVLRLQARRSNGIPLGFGRAALRTAVALWLPIAIGFETFGHGGSLALLETIDLMQPLGAGAVQSLVVATAGTHPGLSLLYVLSIGLAAVHPQKRTLHDILLDTVVVFRLQAEPLLQIPDYASKNTPSGPDAASESA